MGDGEKAEFGGLGDSLRAVPDLEPLAGLAYVLIDRSRGNAQRVADLHRSLAERREAQALKLTVAKR
jgi:hypothetical protein